MYYETIYVSNHDVAQFMNEVKPKSASIDMSDGADVAFEFTDKADFERAQAWVYSHYDFTVCGDGAHIGIVYYDDIAGYCFECAADNHVESGYATPVKAEDGLIEYYYANMEVA